MLRGENVPGFSRPPYPPNALEGSWMGLYLSWPLFSSRPLVLTVFISCWEVAGAWAGGRSQSYERALTCFYRLVGGGGGKSSLILFNSLGAMCQWVSLGPQGHSLGSILYLGSMVLSPQSCAPGLVGRSCCIGPGMRADRPLGPQAPPSRRSDSVS